MHRKATIPALIFAACAASATAFAQVPLGPEFQVNSYTDEDQDDPVVCQDDAGNFVAVWGSTANHDGDQDGVFGQRYTSAGIPIGTEFQVNTYTSNAQQEPAICCTGAGSFIVAWHSDDQDGDDEGVFAQRFDSTGGPTGTEFQVNTYTDDDQDDQAVCCDAAGNFVVAWESDDQDDGDEDGVFAQRFDSNGGAIGTEFQVNTYTAGDEDSPALCCIDGGAFVVTWEAEDQDGDDESIFGQRFDSSGTKQGAEFQVNTYTLGNQYDTAACCDAAGNFVVTWNSYDQDGEYSGVFGQRFTSAGAALGGEFQVNSHTQGYQKDSAVCCDSVGNFVVTWQSFPDQDGEDTGVFGRRFSNTGAAQGPEFQVNTFFIDDQEDPALTCSDDGRFVVVWTGEYNQDGDGDGIFGRRFTLSAPSAAPVLSWFGLALAALGTAAGGVMALRHRRRG